MNTFRDSFGNLDIVDVRPWQAALFDAIRFPEKLKTYISTIIGMFLNCNDIDVQYTKIISILLYRKVIIPFLENLHITFIMNTNIMPTPTTLLPDQNTLLDSITFQHGNDAEQLSNSIRDMLVAQHTIGLVTDANDYANIIRAGFKLIQIRIISVLSQLRHINMNNNIITLRATIDLLLTKIKQLKVSTQDDHNLNIAKTTEIINLRKEIKKLKEEIGLARQDYDVKSKLAVETGGALIDLQVLLDGLRAKILLLEERIKTLEDQVAGLQDELAALTTKNSHTEGELERYKIHITALKNHVNARNLFSTDPEGISIEDSTSVDPDEYNKVIDYITDLRDKLLLLETTDHIHAELMKRSVEDDESQQVRDAKNKATLDGLEDELADLEAEATAAIEDLVASSAGLTPSFGTSPGASAFGPSPGAASLGPPSGTASLGPPFGAASLGPSFGAASLGPTPYVLGAVGMLGGTASTPPPLPPPPAGSTGSDGSAGPAGP